jgi:chemotaxis protein CheC
VLVSHDRSNQFEALHLWNACLATIANALKHTMQMSLPSVLRGDGKTLFDVREGTGPHDLVLFLYIDFMIKRHDIRGFIAFLMDLPSVMALREIVRGYIRGFEAATNVG